MLGRSAGIAFGDTADGPESLQGRADVSEQVAKDAGHADGGVPGHLRPTRSARGRQNPGPGRDQLAIRQDSVVA